MQQLLTKEEQAALDRVKPICAECKHCVVDEWGAYYCGRQRTCHADNVTGTVRTSLRPCDTERGMGLQNSCGRLGKHFEPAPPKKSWLEALISWVS